jgi:hypothetical protein
VVEGYKKTEKTLPTPNHLELDLPDDEHSNYCHAFALADFVPTHFEPDG